MKKYPRKLKIKSLNEIIQNIALPVVLRNAYCLLPENFLVSLLVDDCKDVRNSVYMCLYLYCFSIS